MIHDNIIRFVSDFISNFLNLILLTLKVFSIPLYHINKNKAWYLPYEIQGIAKHPQLQ
jgi:hypothetical protein